MNIVTDESLKAALRPDLQALNATLEDVARQSDGFLGDLLAYVLRGSGKRIRPALVFLFSRFAPAAPRSVQTTALTVELIHIATLIHDDIINNAALRRGQKTVAFEHGVDAAVLLGDFVYTSAFKKLSDLNTPALVGILAHATAVICEGEIQQLKKRYDFSVSESDYFDFIEKKTASLFGACAQAGALLSGQKEELQKKAYEYGVQLGMAFQIVDDLLDLMGDEAVVGKTLRNDLTNGKLTLPLINFRDYYLSPGKKDEFFKQLQNPNGRLNELINEVKSSGALEYSEKVADGHIEKSLAAIHAFPSGSERDHLISLSMMLRDRKT